MICKGTGASIIQSQWPSWFFPHSSRWKEIMPKKIQEERLTWILIQITPEWLCALNICKKNNSSQTRRAFSKSEKSQKYIFLFSFLHAMIMWTQFLRLRNILYAVEPVVMTFSGFWHLRLAERFLTLLSCQFTYSKISWFPAIYAADLNGRKDIFQSFDLHTGSLLYFSTYSVASVKRSQIFFFFGF